MHKKDLFIPKYIFLFILFFSAIRNFQKIENKKEKLEAKKINALISNYFFRSKTQISFDLLNAKKYKANNV
jgi:hypothetical protein